MAVRVTCINKSGGWHDNPHEAISHFGWINEENGQVGKNDRESMWQFLMDGGTAYVRDAYGNVAYVYPKTNRYGTKYLQTEADRTPTDNLLKLDEC